MKFVRIDIFYYNMDGKIKPNGEVFLNMDHITYCHPIEGTVYWKVRCTTHVHEFITDRDMRMALQEVTL